jgi:hypothetical protein
LDADALRVDLELGAPDIGGLEAEAHHPQGFLKRSRAVRAPARRRAPG